MLKQVPFYYVRHGQTDWNLENRAMGQTDILLNANGIRQAMDARHQLKNAGITHICHSPLSRAKHTAEIFNEVLRCELVEIEQLQEFDIGQYQGQIKEQWYKDWRLGAALPTTEPYEEFIERSLRGIGKALSISGLVLIVAHGGVYRAVERALQITLDGDLKNCAPVFHEPPTHRDGSWTVRFP